MGPVARCEPAGWGCLSSYSFAEWRGPSCGARGIAFLAASHRDSYLLEEGNLRERRRSGDSRRRGRCDFCWDDLFFSMVHRPRATDASGVIIEVSETWLNLVRECGQLRTDPFVSINPQMGRLAADLYVQAQQKDAAAPLAIEGLSYALGAELIRESMRKEGAYPPPWLRRLHEQLSENPCGSFTLRGLAASVGIHPVHLSRQFKRYYGEPLWDFLRRRRVEIGAQRILSGCETLCEIAYSLGFSEHAHFTRTFRRFMGVTPSEFRLRQRNREREALQRALINNKNAK